LKENLQKYIDIQAELEVVQSIEVVLGGNELTSRLCVLEEVHSIEEIQQSGMIMLSIYARGSVFE